MPHAPPRFARQAPGPGLAAHVTCYWTLSAEQSPPWKSRILPDGSNDIILDLATEPTAYVVGAMRRAELVPLAGRVDLLGVRFRPGRALPFLRVPLHELTDRQVALDTLWGNAAGSLTDAMRSGRPEQRVPLLERVLQGALHAPRADDDLVQRAIQLMRQTRVGISVREAAKALGAGERRLQRAFDVAVGLSPKRFARVLRFLGAVREIGRRATHPGAALALELGYADQPHFIREFKRLAGVTPAQYGAERRVGFVQDEDPLPA